MDSSEITRLAALHATLDEDGPATDNAALRFQALSPGTAVGGHGALALAQGWMRAGRDDCAAPYLDTAAATLPPAWIAQLHLAAGRPEVALKVLAGQPGTVATATLRRLAAGQWDGPDDTIVASEDNGGEEDQAVLWWGVAHTRRQRQGSNTAVYDALVRAVHAAPWRLDWRFELAGALFTATPPSPSLFAGCWLNLPGAFPGSRHWLLLSSYAHLLAIGHRDQALACGRAAMALDPADPRPYRACAQAMADYATLDHVEACFATFWQGRKSTTHPLSPAAGETLRAAERAAILCPDGATWNDLGTVAFAAGAISTAVDAFRQALVADPAQRHAQINHVIALACLGQSQDAARIIAETTFAAALPKSLLELSDPAGLWPTLPDYREWQRGTVFSQTWWRGLGWPNPEWPNPEWRGDGP